MKNPFVAFLLSFFIPGAGLAYLGDWKNAIINFVVVVLIAIGAAFLPVDSYATIMRYLGFALAGGSGGLD